jgi:hypothetical protein
MLILVGLLSAAVLILFFLLLEVSSKRERLRVERGALLKKAAWYQGESSELRSKLYSSDAETQKWRRRSELLAARVQAHKTLADRAFPE